MIKSISDINAHFKRSHIPDDYSKHFDMLIDETEIIAASGHAIDVAFNAFNYGFSRGWRAAMRYQKDHTQ